MSNDNNVTTVDTPNPDDDGLTHIRLSPNAKTDLGRMLHIGANRPFNDPEYGQFASIAAFWQWYTNGRSDALRDIHHSNMIRSSMYSSRYVAGAEEETMKVLQRSILNNPQLKQAVQTNELPFISYDVVDFKKGKRIVYVSTVIGWYDTAINNLCEQ